MSTKVEETITFDGNNPLVIQYEVKRQRPLRCGGAYIKLLAGAADKYDADAFNERTPFSILFGPNNCGPDVDDVLFIFNHKNPKTGALEEKRLLNTPRTVGNTSLTALYTLIVETDNTFKILVNDQEVRHGSLLEDFEPSVNLSEYIVDMSDKKPDWWDDREFIEDPTAFRPLDIDDDVEWRSPLIANPKFNGHWTPKMIKNPDRVVDSRPNKFMPVSGVGFEVWSEEGGVLFDNILITHDLELRKSFTGETWKVKHELERNGLEALLQSALSSTEDLESIGRQEYDWLTTGFVEPSSLFDRIELGIRRATNLYYEKNDEFKSKCAFPILLFSLISIIVVILLRKIIEGFIWKERKTEKKTVDEDEEIPIFREIQKTAQASEIPAVRRQRMFSSPLQFRQSHSAPSSPIATSNSRRPSTIIEEDE